jgi:cell division protein FtsQ
MRFTSDAAILDAVDMPNVRSFLSLDAAAVKRRIERLAWVDTARIERRLPNVLAIEVTERKPFAVWERGARDLLVDQGGRQLAAVARGAAPGLPRLVGERAPDDARRLLDLIAQYPDVAERLQVAERVGGRPAVASARRSSHRVAGRSRRDGLAMLVEPRPGSA